MNILTETSIQDRLPEKSGKYIVKTVSEYGIDKVKNRTIRIFEARLYINETKIGKKYTWDVNNQLVTHWYE